MKNSETLDYEGEIGVIIGKAGFMIDESNAMDHVWGYTIINGTPFTLDFSALVPPDQLRISAPLPFPRLRFGKLFIPLCQLIFLVDVTAREQQRDHKQFYIGKSADTFCPVVGRTARGLSIQC
jgi:hypothetical protein